MTALEAARQATKRHEWSAVLDALADAGPDLSAEELRLKADAQWWVGDPDGAVETLERAYALLVEGGRPTEAVEVAGLLSYVAMRRQAYSVAGGWAGRMSELLEGQEVSPGHVWLKVLHQAIALFAEGDWDQTAALGAEAEAMAEEMHMPGMRAIAMSFRGYAMIEMGRWKEGMELIDQSTVVAMAEGADVRMAADVYCNTIAACRNLGDYGRAAEWTEEAERWMRRKSVGGYPGICKIHRAELKRLHGSWNEAEEEAKKACRELEQYGLLESVGFAHYEVAEVRRRMGDFDVAERAFDEAYEYGHKGQPGLAMMLLAQGDVEAAARSINQTVDKVRAARADSQGSDHEPSGYMLLSRLLPSQVEIAIAAGDVATAGRAAADLEQMTAVFEGPFWVANAAAAQGRVALASGDPTAAAEHLGKAWRLWADIDLPYEAASARMALGEAFRADGDERGALREMKAARAGFERLGASTKLGQVDELLGEAAPRTPGSAGARTTKVFMFTDIVTSTDLIGLIGDAAWEELLEWHDRALREQIDSAGGTEVRHTGDGFFVTFESARSSIECAVAIQRRLTQHRKDQGFAPMVRIGLHRAEATVRGDDYSGHGVHAAARIGAAAQAEEIVVSQETVESVGPLPFPMSEPEMVELKGLDEPVAVVRVDWS